eukprot:2368889-Rhodomonas_salina.1
MRCAVLRRVHGCRLERDCGAPLVRCTWGVRAAETRWGACRTAAERPPPRARRAPTSATSGVQEQP